MRLTLLAFATLLAAGCGNDSNPVQTDGGAGCFAGLAEFQGVCLTPPTTEAVRTPCGDVTEFCDKTAMPAPNLSCLGMSKMHPATPATVTLTGFVHPFSSGKSNSTVTIQIFKAADLLAGGDPATAPQVVPATTVNFDPATANDPTQFRACDTDPMVGCVAVTPAACAVPVCNDGLMGRQDMGFYCHTVNNAPTCSMRLRWEPRYTIAGVPTNTQLVIRATGANGMADQTWAALFSWNVFLASDDPSCGGDPLATDCLDTSNMASPKYQLNVNTLSQSDYTNIPVAAGLAGGISNGQGAVAGEVHDCDNIRVGNVQVGTKPGGDRLTYFNGNPYNTLPDSGRAAVGTDRLGLFSSLNVSPGKVSVVGAGLVGGKEVSVGTFDAVVFPNSVAVVNLNGGKPNN
jgi:hypothetical protein